MKSNGEIVQKELWPHTKRMESEYFLYDNMLENKNLPARNNILRIFLPMIVAILLMALFGLVQFRLIPFDSAIWDPYDCWLSNHPQQWAFDEICRKFDFLEESNWRRLLQRICSKSDREASLKLQLGYSESEKHHKDQSISEMMYNVSDDI